MLVDQSNQLHSFDNISKEYDKFRPSYPDIVFEFLRLYVNESPFVAYNRRTTNGKIADVGCGTGISTRKLYDYFGDNYSITGIEPSENMRAEAKKHGENGYTGINYIGGRAEDLPFDSGSLKCVLIAQAIQWFERGVFYKEVCRVLETNGSIAVLQNNRNWKDCGFLYEYENLLEKYNKAYNKGYRDIPIADELKKSGLFRDVTELRYGWSVDMDFSRFYGMSLSSSKVNKIVSIIGRDGFRQKLEDVFDKYCGKDGKIKILYTTELFLARSCPR